MTEDILYRLTDWLLTAPALPAGTVVGIDDAGPAPGQAGLFPQGVTVLSRRENVCGGCALRCRAEFLVRLVLPHGRRAHNAAILTELQAWVARQSAAHLAPVFGDEPARETLAAQAGRLESAAPDGTAVHTLRLVAEYTELY